MEPLVRYSSWLGVLAVALAGCSLIVPRSEDYSYCEAGAPPCDPTVDAGPGADGGMDASLPSDAGADAGPTVDGGSDAGVPAITNDLVAAGAAHSCFVRAGEVWCTGSGRATGLPLMRNRPGLVGSPLPNDIIDVAAGYNFTCALSASGRLFCWGDNGAGQLGIGTTDPQDSPVRAADAYDDFDAVNASHSSVCARRRTGEVLCWGDGTDGQLGDGRYMGSSVPVVSGVQNPIRIAGGSSHFCAVTADGQVQCWGLNADGALGSTGFGARSARPMTVPSVNNATDVSAGIAHTCAVSGGAVVCWGNGLSGQMGDGGMSIENGPTSPTGLPPGIELVFAGRNGSCAGAGLNLWCWGSNMGSELGLPSGSFGVLSPEALPPFPVGIRSLAGRHLHACATLSDEQAYCWGTGYEGQIGNGMSDIAPTPVPVSF